MGHLLAILTRLAFGVATSDPGDPDLRSGSLAEVERALRFPRRTMLRVMYLLGVESVETSTTLSSAADEPLTSSKLMSALPFPFCLVINVVKVSASISALSLSDSAALMAAVAVPPWPGAESHQYVVDTGIASVSHHQGSLHFLLLSRCLREPAPVCP